MGKKQKGESVKGSRSREITIPLLIGALAIAGIVVLAVVDSRKAPYPATPPSPQIPGESVTFVADSVTLNYNTHQMEVTGVVRFDGPSPPDRVWVWPYFFGTDDSFGGGNWSDTPIEARVDPGATREARISVSGPFHWWDNSEAPQAGYYARVSVSAVSSDQATLRVAQRDTSPKGAIRVKVVR